MNKPNPNTFSPNEPNVSQITAKYHPTQANDDGEPRQQIQLRELVNSHFSEEIATLRAQFKGAMWNPKLPTATLAKGLKVVDEREELHAHLSEIPFDVTDFFISQLILCYLIENGKTSQIRELVKRDIQILFKIVKELEEWIQIKLKDKRFTAEKQRLLDLSLAIQKRLADALRLVSVTLEIKGHVLDETSVQTQILSLLNSVYENLNELQFFVGCAYQDFVIMLIEQRERELKALMAAYIRDLERKINLMERATGQKGDSKFDVNEIEFITSIRALSVETEIGYSTIMKDLQEFEQAGLIPERKEAERVRSNRKRGVGQRRKPDPEFFAVVVPLLHKKHPLANWDWCILPEAQKQTN